jgi:hypothetical protein
VKEGGVHRGRPEGRVYRRSQQVVRG